MAFGLHRAAASCRVQRLLIANRSHSPIFSTTHARLFLNMPFRPLVSSILGRTKSTSLSSQAPETLPIDIPVDEENAPRYDPEAFYPANPGDVLNDKFELLAKLGWGTSSTVWLAHNTSWNRWTKSNKFVAIKICTRNIVQNESPHDLGTAIESFGLESPTGSTHLALVFVPMREPLWLFGRRVIGEYKVTHPWMPLIKSYLQILLEGLDFLHSEGHIIHTDLKLDNIMVTFEDQSVIEEFVQGQMQHPMARKTIGDRTVYRCRNNFGDIDGKEALKNIYPKITDFGLAQRGDKPGPHIHPIQPDDCHAPEVLLGVGWSYSADIWNFDILIWDFLAGQGLFQQGNPHLYSPVAHLAEMIALIGPVPPTLIQRERDMRHWQWSLKVQNARGELCSNAAEFYGGPFFTNEGEFIRNDLVPYTRSLRKEMPECIPEDEADSFLRFMRRMLS
ncbi:putative serine/threonine-protein kinase [Mariannaea sp. PMI_226]|nr:putative serine/threonine-protein kinase [Mariannaea sp. PMI_226]